MARGSRSWRAAEDHKAIFDGDRGPNTGGMGTVSPAWITEAIAARIRSEILEPTLRGLRADAIDYRGVLYAGVMVEPSGAPYLLEYNCRFGDPETQPLMARIAAIWAPSCSARRGGEMPVGAIGWDARVAVCVVVAAAGYPDAVRTGDPNRRPFRDRCRRQRDRVPRRHGAARWPAGLGRRPRARRDPRSASASSRRGPRRTPRSIGSSWPASRSAAISADARRRGDDTVVSDAAHRWIRGILPESTRDATRAIYRYHLRFADPANDRQLIRKMLVCGVRLEPWADGLVRPHEATDPARKAAALAQLRSTYVAPAPVLAGYRDAAGEIERLLRRSTASGRRSRSPRPTRRSTGCGGSRARSCSASCATRSRPSGSSCSRATTATRRCWRTDELAAERPAGSVLVANYSVMCLTQLDDRR